MCLLLVVNESGVLELFCVQFMFIFVHVGALVITACCGKGNRLIMVTDQKVNWGSADCRINMSFANLFRV